MQSEQLDLIPPPMPPKKPRKRSYRQRVIENLVVHEQFMVGHPDTTKEEKDSFWMREMKMATQLVKTYNLDFLTTVIPPYGKRVPSLSYFMADYGKKYLGEQFFRFKQHTTDLTAKTESVQLESEKIGEDVVVATKPKSLKDFLKMFQPQ